MEDKYWYEAANCATTDPEVMFPQKGGSSKMAHYICSHCTVVEECLADALKAPEQKGIAGNLSPRQRQNLKKALGVTIGS